jgi:lysophospholipase L1-like esterase
LEVPVLTPDIFKTVHLVSDFNKGLYLDRQSLAFRPNLVFIEETGKIVFEINELGMKGDSRDRARQLAVVWGDSVVFGIGKGWPCLLDELAPGYQFLNGGIEGDHYFNILRRASAFNRQHDVALNLVMLGWHPFQRIRRRWTRRPANRTLRADLMAFLAETPNTVLLTMPTALNRKIIRQDLSASFVTEPDPDRYFTFYGAARYSVSIQRETFDYIVERNAIAREVCASRNVRVVDLFEVFNTERLADFRRDFMDVVHPHFRAYPAIAQAVYSGIADLLAPATGSSSAHRRPDALSS